ncbi:DNA-binding protein [Glaesserella parasuis]|uniref:DNA-binding protein n=1 Tax=Glaesserella parasuis TaxID=738 RepID=A0AA42JGQ9_GLAPU|nr:DNA-binding protein [Glaesserella parasuis]MDP0310525.1 DNA-binding protein [Glaesserella parasuis]MDP0329838.1 DNA-binding protein [Glaesserella parasuis]MDP0392758.1 DNA-binding protein [Glaesserella parasuis]MDP0453795.1 DNA-binding protein [Glaesserella parasuis]
MKEWILIKDLIGIEELAGTPQGIAQKAKKENWRRRRVAGVKGNVFEYYVGDMPESVQQALGFTVSQPKQPNQTRDDFIVQTPSGGEFGVELKTRRLKEEAVNIDELRQAIALIEKAVVQIGKARPSELNNIEWHLIQCFRSANEQGRVAILNISETMAAIQDKEEASKLSEASKVA